MTRTGVPKSRIPPRPPSASVTERREAISLYARGDLSWRDLQNRGITRYTDVMADLADMGVPMPIASLEGPNLEMRLKGIDLLRNLLATK